MAFFFAAVIMQISPVSFYSIIMNFIDIALYIKKPQSATRSIKAIIDKEQRDVKDIKAAGRQNDSLLLLGALLVVCSVAVLLFVDEGHRQTAAVQQGAEIKTRIIFQNKE